MSIKTKFGIYSVSALFAVLLMFSLTEEAHAGTVNLSVPGNALAGQAITVSWSDLSSSHYLDWIAIYYTGGADSAYIDWIYANTCGQFYSGHPPTSGSCQFTIPAWMSNGTQLNFRYFGYDSWDKYGTSNILTVGPAIPPVPPAPTCSSAGPDGDSFYPTDHVKRAFIYNPANVTRIYLETWSDHAGKDDVRVYEASVYLGGGNAWYYDIPIANHNDIGNVNVGVYMSNAGHVGVWCDSANFNIVNPPPAPTCTSASPQANTTVSNAGILTATVSGVTNSTDPRFAVWSESGGNLDIFWYTLANAYVQNLGGGSYRANIDLSKHPGVGNIFVHVYMFTGYYTGGVFCDEANFVRLNNGTINVTSNLATTWTLNFTSHAGYGPWAGSGISDQYIGMPYGSYNLTPAAINGYSYTVTPAPQTLPQ